MAAQIETWYHGVSECSEARNHSPYGGEEFEPTDACPTESDECPGPGWYYWFCQPGCLPDSDPFGPFDTEAEAREDARPDDDDPPTLQEAKGFVTWLKDLLDFVDGEPMPDEGAGAIHQVRIETYEEAGLLTRDTGLVIRFTDDNGNRCSFQITIQEDRRDR